jgi:hypothetical protein
MGGGGDPCAIPASSFPISTRGFIAGLTVNFPHPAQLGQTIFLKVYVQSSSHQPVNYTALVPVNYTALVPVKTQDDAAWFLSRHGMNPAKLRPLKLQHSACQTAA